MKRGGLIVLLIAVAAIVAALVACLVQHKSSPVEWLRSEYGLNAAQMKQAAALHDDYRTVCAQLCSKIATTDAALTKAIRSNTTATPQIVAAIAETDRVRTECRIQMLEHFYKTAALMPEDRRAKYLEKVLPLVLHPGEMHAEHSQ
ncbi:MAG: hypothetical protein BGO12_01115 [Verrucomicrobia bacterium 61-8]|nr:periplasmic heavy metal sensor [Verrucomicrobiota bacterium]OJV10749.1 MAG: hypothetical protein BGO12_01115 [Verrucomicrobia bacterium 61-8]